MRALRFLAAVLVWLLATVLLVLAIVLSLTLVLLPVGLLLGAFALRLYRKGLGLLLPSGRDIEKGMREVTGRFRKHPSAARNRPPAASVLDGKRAPRARSWFRR